MIKIIYTLKDAIFGVWSLEALREEVTELAVKLDPRNLYALTLLAKLKARDRHDDAEGLLKEILA